MSVSHVKNTHIAIAIPACAAPLGGGRRSRSGARRYGGDDHGDEDDEDDPFGLATTSAVVAGLDTVPGIESKEDLFGDPSVYEDEPWFDDYREWVVSEGVFDDHPLFSEHPLLEW